ncbi:RNA polymerase sigma-70 factor [Bacillus sonorensis]|mgnify:CR=1 FL=1|uniref:RNA polymerase sigma-70 factor n=2 Tax=Bacillus sonorensis TaxID=119858 RepID=M5PDM9_9BACI|nr:MULTISPECIES: RNA polymerase sigma-70 factor [Bacillus]TWK86240.1 ECF RNA polymerase sigma factor SigJ [Bacillus paralicheniformis]ASB91549.1 putative ECF RNA polymerase sigma factor SigI [Bacillus sonorensis]EME73912.1 RNA polymerase sigma-70 factor [Bacillus sonorensis L12]MBG9914844.1 RNA polymerase [Bacillus sonorensis]MCF7615849.1 RNA polymerase sigma-70 factor [Bacillus sonorensis]
MDVYQTYWSLLHSVAYRMVGSLQDAEDIVQELFADLQERDISQIEEIQPYLLKSITNRCINFLKSARKKREVYVGEWLPEPQITLAEQNPAEVVVKDEMISYALLVVMSRLNPVERAVFMFREVFGYNYKEISSIIEKSEANCRKIYSRIKHKVSGELSAVSKPKEEHQLAELFIASTKAGDFDDFARRLAEEAVLYTDGGGKVRSAIRPIYGRSRIYAFFKGIASKGRLAGHLRYVSINGQRGVLIERNKRPIYAICFAWSPKRDKIQHVYIISNPDKLKHIHM